MAPRHLAIVLLALFSCGDDSNGGCATAPEDAGAECTDDGDCLYCCEDERCGPCDYPRRSDECEHDSECGDDICHQGDCVECAEDAHCSEDMGGVECVQVVAGEPEMHCGCLSDLHCAGLARGTKCLEGGACGCTNDDDCPDEKWCASRECFPYE